MVESNKMKLSFTNLDRIYVVFILFCNNNKKKNKQHPASGRVGATADMKRQWYRVKIKLDKMKDAE